MRLGREVGRGVGGRVGAGIWCEGDFTCRVTKDGGIVRDEELWVGGGILDPAAVFENSAPLRCLETGVLIKKKKENQPRSPEL